ncbi:hypothetical protein ACODT5_46960 [Streptomyces sp. 5.8]|uniref:hypothetical protein n=1 Tax=Streptomyces sp. 5.8 TaxID=3406571 RepID=UPI003BB514AE
MSRLQGIGPTLTALVSGSMILGGKICRCLPIAASWAWDMAAQDPAATAEKQEEADKAAKKKVEARLKARRARRRKKAAAGEEPEEDEDEEHLDPETATAPPVAPVIRGRGDTAGILGIGAAIGAGGLYAAWMLVGEAAVTALAPQQPLILTAGGLAWVAAALMLAPPLPVAKVEEDQGDDPDEEFEDEDLEDDADRDDIEEDLDDDVEDDADTARTYLSPGQKLQRHILARLAQLEDEYGGKGGLHVVSLIASAEAAGLLSPGAMTKKDMRDWLEASKVPVAKSTRQPKGVPPLGSEVDYGVKVEELAGVLGSSVSVAFRNMYPTTVETPPPAPVQTPAQTPVEAPVRAPAEAPSGVPGGVVAGGVPGPRLRLVQPLSPDPSQGSTQDTA